MATPVRAGGRRSRLVRAVIADLLLLCFVLSCAVLGAWIVLWSTVFGSRTDRLVVAGWAGALLISLIVWVVYFALHADARGFSLVTIMLTVIACLVMALVLADLLYFERSELRGAASHSIWQTGWFFLPGVCALCCLTLVHVRSRWAMAAWLILPLAVWAAVWVGLNSDKGRLTFVPILLMLGVGVVLLPRPA